MRALWNRPHGAKSAQAIHMGKLASPFAQGSQEVILIAGKLLNITQSVRIRTVSQEERQQMVSEIVIALHKRTRKLHQRKIWMGMRKIKKMPDNDQR